MVLVNVSPWAHSKQYSLISFPGQVVPLTPAFCTLPAVSFIANFLRLEDACNRMATGLQAFSGEAEEPAPAGAGVRGEQDQHASLLQQPRRYACAALPSRLLMNVLKSADFLDIEGLHNTALLELMQRILKVSVLSPVCGLLPQQLRRLMRIWRKHLSV